MKWLLKKILSVLIFYIMGLGVLYVLAVAPWPGGSPIVFVDRLIKTFQETCEGEECLTGLEDFRKQAEIDEANGKKREFDIKSILDAYKPENIQKMMSNIQESKERMQEHKEELDKILEEQSQ